MQARPLKREIHVLQADCQSQTLEKRIGSCTPILSFLRFKVGHGPVSDSRFHPSEKRGKGSLVKLSLVRMMMLQNSRKFCSDVAT